MKKQTAAEWMKEKYESWLLAVDKELQRLSEGRLNTQICNFDYWGDFRNRGNSEWESARRIMRIYNERAIKAKPSEAQRELLVTISERGLMKKQFSLNDLNFSKGMVLMRPIRRESIQALIRKDIIAEHEIGRYSVTAVGLLAYHLID